MGWPMPSFIVASMSSLLAMPFSRSMIASLIMGMRIAFEMNPGWSFDTATVLPHASPNALARRRVASLVCIAGIISTSFICGTGLKKWIPTTRDDDCPSSSAWRAAPANRVSEMDDVFVPMIAGAGSWVARRCMSDSLRSVISGIASITRSVSACTPFPPPALVPSPCTDVTRARAASVSSLL